MNVDMHGLDRTETNDFTDPSDRTRHAPPFVAIKLIDGKGSVFTIFLREPEEAYKLVEAAREAMDILGIAVS